MWFTVVLIIQILVILAMIAAVLLQRSEGGALGMGGGGGGGGLMSNRGVGSALTRATGILAGMFFICSITLTILARGLADNGLDFNVEGEASAPTPTTMPALDIPAVPLGEDDPSVAGENKEAETGSEDDRPQIPE